MPAGQTVSNGLPFLQCRSDIHIKNLWTRIYISHKSIGSPGELYNLKTCQSPFSVYQSISVQTRNTKIINVVSVKSERLSSDVVNS